MWCSLVSSWVPLLVDHNMKQQALSWELTMYAQKCQDAFDFQKILQAGSYLPIGPSFLFSLSSQWSAYSWWLPAFPGKFKNSYQNHGTFELLPTLCCDHPLDPFLSICCQPQSDFCKQKTGGMDRADADSVFQNRDVTWLGQLIGGANGSRVAGPN